MQRAGEGILFRSLFPEFCIPQPYFVLRFACSPVVRISLLLNRLMRGFG